MLTFSDFLLIIVSEKPAGRYIRKCLGNISTKLGGWMGNGERRKSDPFWRDRSTTEHWSRPWAERKTERSGPKIQMSGTVGINERSAEREVAERERSGERTESAAHAAKACTISILHFSEAKRGPGPGTSRLDFGGNPMTF